MEFITSKRSAPKLCFEGFTYSKKKESKTTIAWECTQRRTLSCSGAVITDLPATKVRSSREHCHDPVQHHVAALKLRQNIDESAASNRGLPGQILADKLVSQPVEVRVAAGSMETIKRTIRRKRAGAVPKNPSNAAEIPFPLPENFSHQLIYDNGSSTSRMLVFGSGDGLRLLHGASTWFMDGTHSTAPQQFAQVFTVRVELGETSATAVYALLPSKTQEVYEECLTAILDACLEKDVRPRPVKIVADYEVAIHNAVHAAVSPNIRIQGCFYHLTQSTWRHLQAEGLAATYKDDPSVRHFCGMLDGLAFLPETDVLEGLRILQDQAPDELADVVTYFDRNYVNGGYRTVRTASGGLKFRRTPPRYEPATWNVHQATISGEARTNNICESWNSGFRSLVGHNHPSLWNVIDCFAKDASLVEAEIHRVSTGQPTVMPVRRGQLLHQRTLRTLCQQRASGQKSIKEFLQAIGGHIRLR